MRFLIFSLFFIVHLEAASFHAILVGDPQDELAGVAIAKDLAMMQKIATEMADLSGLNLQLALFEGRERLVERLKEHFQNMRVSADDAIFFYQSSHGYKSENNSSPWPVLIYREENMGVPLELIHDYLWHTRPRFLLCVAHACNIPLIAEAKSPSDLPTSTMLRAKELPLSQRQAIARRCYTKLWRKTKGSLMVSSSKPFQATFGGSQGGSFTLQFVKALREASQGLLRPEWEIILHRASEWTEKLAKFAGKEQTPQFAWINNPDHNSTQDSLPSTLK